MTVLGLDTSNYTTSVAVFDGQNGWNEGRLLDVRPGELGLRQSDALFQHVKRLPMLFERMKEQGLLTNIQAVGASTKRLAQLNVGDTIGALFGKYATLKVFAASGILAPVKE